MKGFALAAAVLLLLAGGNAIAQQTDESYFNEAVENSDGSASGKLNVLRSEGQLPSMLYHIENDGYFQVFDEQSEQMVSHGIISSDGKVESKPPGKHVERPGRPTTRRTLGFCALGEAIGLARCAAQCGSNGVQSYSSGICGFQSTCACHVPLPPPVEPTTPPGDFTPPWLTIDNFWNRYNVRDDCIGVLCDSRSPL